MLLKKKPTMSKYQTFEELPVWQSSRKLACRIHKICSEPPFRNDRALVDQIRRAAISIVSNIAEGFERKSDKEFMNFLNIAKGSAGEVRAQLYLALDFGYISDDFHKNLANEFRSISSQIAGLIGYVQNKPQK